MKRIVLCLGVLAAVCWSAGVAEAQGGIGTRRVGIRGGVTIDPDQAHVGFHINAGNFADKVRFQPSFTVGFGSDRVLGSINLDVLYTFDPSSVAPYLGGGLGVALSDKGSGRNGDDFDAGAGLNLLGGFEWGDRNKYMLEARVGIGDIPSFMLSVGFNF